MTTMAYRSTQRRQGSPLFGTGLLARLSTYGHKLSGDWRQWQAARELDSMPLDMRKDFGWPAADNMERRK